jgi:uncharacterized membrane protein YfcA
MNPITALLVALGALTAVFVGAWTRAVVVARRVRDVEANPALDARFPTVLQLATGAGTNFLDTLGIGSFATTTAIFRFLKMLPDRIIPGTLNTGHTLPTVTQAFIYTAVIPVDVVTLVSMIAAAILGAWLGAGIVAKWSKRKVQFGMGFALLAAAVFFVMRQLGLFPQGSDAIGVEGSRLAMAVGGNFGLGALMTLGIGLYAPCMILVSLLGMSERTAFPIMMGSCAFLMPVGSLQFVRKNAYNLRASLGLTLGGPLAVLIAAFIVESLPLFYVRWLVVVVVVYTASMMLRAASSERRAAVARQAMASTSPLR